MLILSWAVEIMIRIYSDRDLFNRALKEEIVFRQMAESSEGGKYFKNRIDNNIEFAMYVTPKNFKIIKGKDSFSQSEINKYKKKYKVIDEYNTSLEHLISKRNKLTLTSNEELNSFSEKEKIKYKFKSLSKEERELKRAVNRNIRSIKIDMKDYLDSVLRTVSWKSPLPDKGKTDWDKLDMMDKTHVKELLKIKSGGDFSDDLNYILLDLEVLIRKIKFTVKQLNVLKLWRNDKTQEEIAIILGISQQMVNKYIDSCVEKIVDYYTRSYEDWYYLNLVKGEYKTCSKCKKVKLIRDFYKVGTKKYKSKCKYCK
jgi:predicted transcriptional regulator